jgi:hypothetical protein
MRDGPPFEFTLHVRDTCLCLHVQRAARALARRFDDVLRPLGLTNGQFSLLMSLNRPEPPKIGSVANLLAMDRTTLTGMEAGTCGGRTLDHPNQPRRIARRIDRAFLSKYLPLYVAQLQFRYNNRSNADIFGAALRGG